MTDAVRLALDPFDITARARAAYGPDGRLPLPHTAHWPIFPFETDDLQVRHVEDPVLPEPARRGEAAEDCSTCQSADDPFVWNEERCRIVGRWRRPPPHLRGGPPAGMMQLRGLFLTTWLYALPPLSPELWAAIRSHVATTVDAPG